MTHRKKPLILGTRGSDLAMWQARTVAGKMTHPVEIREITTSGDRLRDIALQGGTQTGFFTKEIEEHLLKGDIDIAVHSLKDLPTTIAAGLTIAACLPRADVRDVLLVHDDWHEPGKVLPVKAGTRIGAGSLRRQALIRLFAPQATPELIRGNVPTRVEKCRTLQYGAVVLARAGVERLGLDLSPLHVYELNPLLWLPAPGQGAVAVQVRSSDADAYEAVQEVNDPATSEAVALERRLLASFEGGCHTAFGAHAVREGDLWTLRIGMDRPASGWGQRQYSGPFEALAKLGPTELPTFEAPVVNHQEELCRPANW